LSNTAFVAARMGSERLPGKVIKEFSGIPSLVHIFNILKESQSIDDFAVLTTVLAEDDIIENICKENSIKVYRGSVHDVLDRFRMVAEILKPQRIIRVTGDDPLMDPEIIDKVVNEHITGDFDYTSNIIKRTYPRGMDTEVIEYEALERSWKNTSDRDDHEHVTLYIRRNPNLFRMQNVMKEGICLDELRLCIDTEEDSNLISEIYNNLYKNRPIKLGEVTEFLDKNTELKKINSNIQQKHIKGKLF